VKLDLGTLPIDREVRPVLEAAVAKIADLYGGLEERGPDFTGAMDAFMRLRGSILYRTLGHLLEAEREKLTPSVIWKSNAARKFPPTTSSRRSKNEAASGAMWRTSFATTTSLYA
jgi:hypothetical protein